MIREIPDLEHKQLITILDAFSRDPETAYVFLFGDFDYSFLSKQTERIIQGCSINGSPLNLDTYRAANVCYKLNNCNRDLIKRILEQEKEADSSKGASSFFFQPDWKLVRFYSADWHGDGTFLRLERTGLTAHGNPFREPEYKRLKRSLKGSGLEIRILYDDVTKVVL